MRAPFVVTSLVLVVAACSSASSSDLGNGSQPGVDSGGGGSEGTDSGSGFTGGEDSGTAEDTGAPTDSGTPVDAGGDSGIPSCVGMAFCEDFESYPTGAITNASTLGPWKTSVAGGAAMMVDGVKPYSGTKALHITAPIGTAANGTLTQTKAAGLVGNNDVWGRAMVFYSTSGGNDLPKGVHSWIFNGSGNSPASGGNVAMNVANNGTNYFLNYHPATGAEQSVTGGTPAGGAWLCEEWEYDGSGTPPKDEGKIWINGKLVVDAVSKGWDFATPWSTFAFGLQHYQTTTNTLDVYLDDFALNDARIGCP